MKFSNEIRVGAVVLIGLGLMMFGYFYLRGIGLGADLYYMRLNGAATVAQGNDVRLQGVKIGQIQEIGFDRDTGRPLLTLAVRRADPPFRLLKNYSYSIKTSGIIGESYVDVRGPFARDAQAYLPDSPDVFIPGKAASGILGVENSDQLIRDFQSTLKNLNVTLDRVNKGVLNYDNQQKLAKTLDGMAKLTNNASKSFGPNGFKFGLADQQAQRNLNLTLQNAANASRFAEVSARNIAAASSNAQRASGDLIGIAGDLRGVVRENRGQLNGLLGNMNSAAKNIAGLTETLDFTLRQGGFKENSQIAFQSLRRAAENVEVATAGLRALADDKTTQTDLKTTLTALRESTEALRDTAQTIRAAVTNEETGKQLQGTLATLGATAKNLESVTAGLNKIVGDESLQNNLKGAAENLNGTLAATRGAAERINSLLGGRKNRKAGETPGGAASEPPPQRAGYAPGGFDFTYRRLGSKSGAAPTGRDNSQRNYGDITFNTELFDAPFRLGLSNIGEGDDFTLQTGQFIGPAALRYGIYRSQLGAGVDLRRGRFSIEGNVWNPNNRSYNLYGGFQLTPQLEILAGRENIRGTRSNSIAVRITP